jgi:glucokinase
MFLSIDIGGTSSRIASSRDLKNIVKEVKFDTSQELPEQKKLVSSGIKEVLDGETLEAACLGVPGLVDKKNRRLGKIVNVPALSGLPFSYFFDDHLKPENIWAENDASLAGLGEAVMGAGKDYEVVAYLTLSTGVGGVRIAGKKIDPFQNHSEPGHMIIVENGRHFKYCGQDGCLSAYVSGTAFKEIYGLSAADCRDAKVWEDYAEKLSLGLNNVIALWAPDVIVLGGSMTKEFDPGFKDPLMKNLSQNKLFTAPPIVVSQLGDSSGLFGGLVFLSQNIHV